MISKRDGQEKDSESEMMIYIGSIDPRLTFNAIEKYFRDLGLKISLQKNRKKKTKHFLLGKTKDEKTFNYLTKIKKEHSIEGGGFTTDALLTGEQKILRDVEESKKKIFVENLPTGVTDDELKDFFQKFGPVKAAYTKKRLKKYEIDDGEIIGFVIFFNEEDVLKMLNQSTSTYFNGTKIFIRPFKPKWTKASIGEKRIEFSEEEKNSLVEIIKRKGRIPLKKNYKSIDDLFRKFWKEMKIIKDFSFSSQFLLDTELLRFVDIRHKVFPENLRFRKEHGFY